MTASPVEEINKKVISQSSHMRPWRRTMSVLMTSFTSLPLLPWCVPGLCAREVLCIRG